MTWTRNIWVFTETSVLTTMFREMSPKPENWNKVGIPEVQEVYIKGEILKSRINPSLADWFLTDRKQDGV